MGQVSRDNEIYLLVSSSMEVKSDNRGVVTAREIKSGTAHGVDERVDLARLDLSHSEL